MTRAVIDDSDWKRKYLDALREAEAEQARWNAQERVLRRIVSRLCAVGMGTDPEVDVLLQRLAESARRDSDTAELQAVAESLADSVLALDRRNPTRTLPATEAATPPEPTPPVPLAESPVAPPGEPRSAAERWSASCTVAKRLLDELDAADAPRDATDALRATLSEANEDRDLAVVLDRIGDLIAARAADVAVERTEAAAMLAQVTTRLNEMSEYLSGDSADRKAVHDAADTLNVQILSQVERLGGEVRSSTDLRALQTLVAQRLEAVSENLREFRAREARRFEDYQARSENMRLRITQLEAETHSLSQNLDLEKRRARTDPLTRVANRASFDERMKQELARWQRYRTPVCLLVWDIDHFKAVNDTHGHRAGDGLLRAVADCLSEGRRGVDLVARFGGEEFATLLVGSSLTDALKVANQTRERIAALKMHFRGTPVPVTISCGLTEVRDGDTATRVFDRADAALYRAKEQGRNRCVAE